MSNRIFKTATEFLCVASIGAAVPATVYVASNYDAILNADIPSDLSANSPETDRFNHDLDVAAGSGALGGLGVSAVSLMRRRRKTTGQEPSI